MSVATLPPLVAQARIDTPLGPLTAVAGAHGLAGLWFDAQTHHPGLLDVPVDPAHPVLAEVREQLRRYWDGELPDGFDLPLEFAGTPFQQAVWHAMATLAAGSTCSYGELAQRAGRPGAVRAVGAAVGRNPVSLVVPCHRVLGADGSLTGYAGGLDRKRALLAHEAAA